MRWPACWFLGSPLPGPGAAATPAGPPPASCRATPTSCSFGRNRAHGAQVPKVGLRATLNGKPVRVATRDVHAGTYTLRFIEVASDRPGELKLELADERVVLHDSESHGIQHDAATFAIGTPPAAGTPTATIRSYHELTQTMQEMVADGVYISVDVPAIAFELRWRADDKDDWKSLTLPALTIDGAPTARLGADECARPNVPIDLLKRGLAVKLTALLPDGTSADVKLPDRVMWTD